MEGTITIRLPGPDRQKLKEIAQKKDMTVSAYIRLIIHDEINKES